jgi:hypothetical protein
MKGKIVIPFKIFNMDAIAGEDLKSFKNGEIFGKGERLLLRGNFLKTKEELEEIAQDHQMAHVLLFQIQESEKGLHLFTILSGEMGV